MVSPSNDAGRLQVSSVLKINSVSTIITQVSLLCIITHFYFYFLCINEFHNGGIHLPHLSKYQAKFFLLFLCKLLHIILSYILVFRVKGHEWQQLTEKRGAVNLGAIPSSCPSAHRHGLFCHQLPSKQAMLMGNFAVQW